MPEKNSLNRAVFSNLRRSDVIDVESPRCSRCADQELSPIQRNIMESMPELTGVWFYRGEVRGKVNLDRTPNHGWFEMYVEKTGELQTSPIPTGGTLSTP